MSISLERLDGNKGDQTIPGENPQVEPQRKKVSIKIKRNFLGGGNLLKANVFDYRDSREGQSFLFCCLVPRIGYRVPTQRLSVSFF